MPRARVAASVLTLAFAFALAGCSDTSLLDSPATGDVIEGSAYRFTAPLGWTAPDAVDRAAGADTEVEDDAAGDGFTDTMTVVLSPVGALTPDQVESAGVAELEGAGLRDVSAQDRVVVGGSESAHLTGTRLTNAAVYVIDQYYLTHDGQTWVVTFAFDGETPQEDRDDLAGSVLVTWQWI